MRVRMDYGKTGHEVELPDTNVIGVLGLSLVAPLPNPIAAIDYALQNPIGTPSLTALSQDRKNACIVVCDITRPVPNADLLPPILRILEQSGMSRENITILIATGTHRPNHGAELDAMLGPAIARQYRIVNHDCKDLESHAYVGVSPDGIPIWLDKTYCQADLKITIGLIEPHFMAGYSGGRKLVMPGLAAMETVKRWHCPRFLESPYATMGVVDGNPVHIAALAIARRVAPDLILDVTLDDSNQITGVFAGDVEEAWRAGVAFTAQHVRAKAAHPADIVVTSSAGHPLDTTFYQAIKGMVSALPAVKPSGTIVIAAQCAEGLGSPEFAKALLEISDLEEFVQTISQPDVFVPEEWQIEELARAVRHANIICISDGIASETLAKCFVTPAHSLDAGIRMALERQGPDATILAIPRGPYIIPFV